MLIPTVVGPYLIYKFFGRLSAMSASEGFGDNEAGSLVEVATPLRVVVN